jgi:hypothetical protein
MLLESAIHFNTDPIKTMAMSSVCDPKTRLFRSNRGGRPDVGRQGFAVFLRSDRIETLGWSGLNLCIP